MPSVSVLLPAHNAQATIERAARSILDQTLAGIELIIVDDGSTDDTASVVRSIDDPRVVLIEQSHRGVAAAANAALAAAGSPHVARMDADDFAYPTRLERQLAWLTRHNLDAVGSQVRIADQHGEPVESLARYQRWINEETLTTDAIHALRFVEYPLANPTLLARREFFELGYRDGPFPEDYDLMLRAAAQGMRLGKAPEVLLDWIDHGRRLTRCDSRYSNQAFDRCRREHLLAGPLRDVNRVDLAGVGKTGKPWLRWLQAEGIAVRRAYEVNPRKFGAVIHGVRVEDSDQMPRADGTPLVIAVGSEGAREAIAVHINSRGYTVGRDAWFVA